MDNESNLNNIKSKMKCKDPAEAIESEDEDEPWDSEDDDETIARIQRAHFAQTAAMSQRRRPPPKPRPMSQKRKMEAVKHFHDFTKKLKKDTGITIRSLTDNNLLELNEFSSADSDGSDSDGLSEEEFEVNLNAVNELNEEDNSYIDPETGDFIETKKVIEKNPSPSPLPTPNHESNPSDTPKTLTISDIINEGDLDLTKNVEIAEVEGSELCQEKHPEDLLDIKQEENSQDFDITEKLKEMGEISVKQVKKDDNNLEHGGIDSEKKSETEEEVSDSCLYQ